MRLLLGGKGEKDEEKKKNHRKMLILLLRLLFKLPGLEAGLKASGFMACHCFLGLV